MNVIVRPAAERDAEVLSRIYAPYVATAVSFEYIAPDAGEFAARIRDTSAVYPFLVCEIDGTAVGYAYAHRLRERKAFDWSAELSIYLDSSVTGRGIGKPLYTAVLELLTIQGFRSAYGSVVVPNEKSERLHLACEFTETGVWRRTGYKLGAWRDLKWFQKTLRDADGEPAPIIPFPLLDKDRVAPLLDDCSQKIAAAISQQKTSR